MWIGWLPEVNQEFFLFYQKVCNKNIMTKNLEGDVVIVELLLYNI